VLYPFQVAEFKQVAQNDAFGTKPLFHHSARTSAARSDDERLVSEILNFDPCLRCPGVRPRHDGYQLITEERLCHQPGIAWLRAH